MPLAGPGVSMPALQWARCLRGGGRAPGPMCRAERVPAEASQLVARVSRVPRFPGRAHLPGNPPAFPKLLSVFQKPCRHGNGPGALAPAGGVGGFLLQMELPGA